MYPVNPIKRTISIIVLIPLLIIILLIILQGIIFAHFFPSTHDEFTDWLISSFDKTYATVNWQLLNLIGGKYSNSYINALVKMDDTILKTYIEKGLKSNKPYLRKASLNILNLKCLSLGKIITPETVSRIREIFMADGEIATRISALHLLPWIENGDILEKDMLFAFNGKSDVLRDAVVDILGYYNKKESIPHLVKILELAMLVKDKDFDAVYQKQGRGSIVIIDPQTKKRSTWIGYPEENATVRNAQKYLKKM